MKMMKMVMVLLAAFVAGSVFAAKLSLSEARSQIGACIAKPAKMTAVVKQLDAADQVAFLAAVNEAISGMPGSNEKKAAAYLNVCRAAVSAADKKKKMEMIAEVFATVPPEVLTIVNERFAADLLNIDADPSRKVSAEQFTRVALKIMDAVNARCASVENAGVRAGFAALMMIRASNGSIPDLTEQLVKKLPEAVQDVARREWFPAAMGADQSKTYEPMLGSVEDGAVDLLANDVVIRLVGPQLLEALLPNIVEGTPIVNNSNRPVIYGEGVRETEIQPQPPTDPRDEPGGYQGQMIGY